MKKKIYLSPPDLRGNEQALLQEVFSSNWIAPRGEMLGVFEKKVSAFIGIDHALALNSGTASIHLGLQVLGVQKGDKVLCASFTFIASANPISYLGAIPIFVDAEKDTWNICPELLEKAIVTEIEKGVKPKVLVLVHGYGTPAKMDEILAITQKYDILVLEDAASALGAKYKNKYCGTFGDVGVFSFNGNKMITTSGGGMLVSNHKKHIEKALYLATQAKENSSDYLHNQIGYNYRLSNVLAAIGVAQMDLLPEFLKARKENHEFYKQAFLGLDIRFLQTQNTGNHWLTSVLFKSHKIKEQIRLALEIENIESRSLWRPMHLQTVYKDHVIYKNEVSEDLYLKGLSLPSASSLNKTDLERICEIVRKNI